MCGRTILDGEKVHRFVSAEGHHRVCPLCAERAERHGWVPADQEGAAEMVHAKPTRKPGFFARLFDRPERAGRDEFDGLDGRDELDEFDEEEFEPAPPAVEAAPAATHELETQRYDVEAVWREAGAVEDGADERPTARGVDLADAPPADARPFDLDAPADELPHGHAAALPSPDDVPEPETSPAPQAAPAPAAEAHSVPLPDPAGRGMRPRRLQQDVSPATRFERAVARFNAGDAGRTVGGLTRTLGAPSVSVGDLAGEEDVVRVTVAWELTWYQWGVDLGDELRPVYELAKGFEVSEIESSARQWNASAHDGRIVMVAPARREGANGRPVHR